MSEWVLILFFVSRGIVSTATVNFHTKKGCVDALNNSIMFFPENTKVIVKGSCIEDRKWPITLLDQAKQALQSSGKDE